MTTRGNIYERHATRATPRPVIAKILVVCEGKKTEPNYFKAFDNHHCSGYNVSVKTDGTGKNTLQVVDKAIRRREDDDQDYDSVWAVFDKDDFPDNDFNSAISMAEAKGIGCAWSNEAFELWYLCHFQNRITAMSRDEYKAAISKAVNDAPGYKKMNKSKKPYKYAKNDPENYTIMTTCGSQCDAIKFAKAQSKTFNDERYAMHNPCTMVFKLVLQLTGKDMEFNKRISDDINK